MLSAGMAGDADLAAEANQLKQKIKDARKEVCDTDLAAECGSVEALKLAIRVRKTLRGHLSKVNYFISYCQFQDY